MKRDIPPETRDGRVFRLRAPGKPKIRIGYPGRLTEQWLNRLNPNNDELRVDGSLWLKYRLPGEAVDRLAQVVELSVIGFSSTAGSSDPQRSA